MIASMSTGDEKMLCRSVTGNDSKEFRHHHWEIKRKINALKGQYAAYLIRIDLKEAKCVLMRSDHTMNQNLQLFEDQPIRTAWNETTEEWYFSIVDVVGILTESPNPQTYWRVLKKRLKDEGNESCRWQTPSYRCGKHRATSPPHPVHSFKKSRAVQTLAGTSGQSAN